jgi:flagellar basal-body rod modification protein FlgD
MSDVSNATNSLLQDMSIANKAKSTTKGTDELGQKAFLNLMIAQLENQDPLSPQENGEFIAQLAQFSSVENLDRLNNNFDQFSKNFMSNQALQASTLVGRSVSVQTDKATLTPENAVSGLIDVPATTQDLNIEIYSPSGSLVDAIPVGSAPAGDVMFRWNGSQVEINGKLLNWKSRQPEGVSAGQYKFKAVSTQDGKPTQLNTYLSANVNSVTLGNGGGLTLNLAGVGAVNLNDVKQISE